MIKTKNNLGLELCKLQYLSSITKVIKIRFESFYNLCKMDQNENQDKNIEFFIEGSKNLIDGISLENDIFHLAVETVVRPLIIDLKLKPLSFCRGFTNKNSKTYIFGLDNYYFMVPEPIAKNEIPDIEKQNIIEMTHDEFYKMVFNVNKIDTRYPGVAEAFKDGPIKILNYRAKILFDIDFQKIYDFLENSDYFQERKNDTIFNFKDSIDTVIKRNKEIFEN